MYFNTSTSEMNVFDGTTWAAIKSSAASMTVYKYTATASQTVFTGADDSSVTLAIVPANTWVTLNGVVLEQGTDYTATTTTITLSTGADVNDELNVYAFNSFEVADYTQFPFFKASGASASIDLTGFNSIPFFKADNTADNIALA
jgi:hypothetical protein